MDDPLGLRIGARHALSGVGVFQVAKPVPDQTADVQLIVEDADAALRIADDAGSIARYYGVYRY